MPPNIPQPPFLVFLAPIFLFLAICKGILPSHLSGQPETPTGLSEGGWQSAESCSKCASMTLAYLLNLFPPWPLLAMCFQRPTRMPRYCFGYVQVGVPVAGLFSLGMFLDSFNFCIFYELYAPPPLTPREFVT